MYFDKKVGYNWNLDVIGFSKKNHSRGTYLSTLQNELNFNLNKLFIRQIIFP